MKSQHSKITETGNDGISRAVQGAEPMIRAKMESASRRPGVTIKANRARIIVGLALAVLLAQHAATGAQAPVELGSDKAFAILAGTTVTITGGGTINGNIGIYPGTTYDPGVPAAVVNGTVYAGGPVAAQAQADLTAAFNDAAGRTNPVAVAGNIGGQTLAPGLYKSTSTLAISSGDLTLDAQGDPNAVFIFQIGSSFTMTSGRQVILAGGAKASNIFWQVGSSATLGTTAVIHGNILASASISLLVGAKLHGRALARSGAVTLTTDGGTLVTDPVPPPAPQNLTASDGTYSNKVAILWSATFNTTGYAVYRNTSNDSAAAVLLVNTSTNMADDSTAAVGTVYFYWVRSFNDDGISPFSASDAGYAADAVTAPAFPIGVTATKGAFTDRVRITWTAVSNAASYEVFRNTIADAATATHLTPDVLNSPFDDMTAVIGTTYYYWVKARNLAGSSLYSAYDSGYAVALVTVPAAPIGVTATKGAFTDRVRITWAAVSNAASYEVYRNTPAYAATATHLLPDVLNSPFDDATAVSGTIYNYWVKAKNSAGSSPLSASDFGYATNPIAGPDFPVGVTATKGAFTDRIRVSWTAVASAAAYEVYRNTSVNSATADKLQPDALSAPFDDVTAAVGATYYYWVKARNTVGASAFSAGDYGFEASPYMAADFDGDGRADPAAFFDGAWYVWLSGAGYRNVGPYTFGPAGTVPVTADFDGDGLADPAAYVAGSWSAWLSGAGYLGVGPYTFGPVGAAPVAADFDGDGLADPAAYVAGSWSAWLSGAGYLDVGPYTYGPAGAAPVAADFDGDGLADPAIYIEGEWYAWLSGAGYRSVGPFAFGPIGAAPVAADFDGDGLADPAVIVSNQWTVWLSSAGYAPIGPYPFQPIVTATIP